MAVFRIERTRDYTVMSNHHLRNEKLSLKAKGLLSMMLSLPEDWNYTTRGLAKICKEGVDAIGGALRELEAAGYIVRHKLLGFGPALVHFGEGDLGGIHVIRILIVFSQHFQTFGSGFSIADDDEILNLSAFFFIQMPADGFAYHIGFPAFSGHFDYAAVAIG